MATSNEKTTGATNVAPAPGSYLHPEILRGTAEANRLTVFYHGGCSDGITGAWAIYRALPDNVRQGLKTLGGVFTDGRASADIHDQLGAGGPVFVGLAHTDPAPAPDLIRGRHVMYVDIVPSKAETLDQVAADARTLTILDHHRSAKAVAERLAASGSAAVVYTEDLSGAQIAWDWAHRGVAWTRDTTKADVGTDRPQVVDFVGARDRWDFRAPGSRAGSKALYTEGHVRGFEPLDALMKAGNGAVPPEMVARGESYLLYEDSCVARIASSARGAIIRARLPGEDTPREYCVRVVNTPIFQSEVGERIMELAPPEVHFAVMWSYVHDRDEIWAAARTNRPDVDLSAITPYIENSSSGGGHPRAAGFAYKGRAPRTAFPPIDAAKDAPAK